MERTVPSRSSAALLSLRDVGKRFGTRSVLESVSLSLHNGEFFCLLGASGCGKSTLLRLVAGLEHPDTGDIELDGQSLLGRPPHRRPVNLMFQSYALFPHLSVYDNVAFGLQQEKLAGGTVRTRVAEMLALLRIEDCAERRPQQISGGQRQRVALARALVKRPRLLLLDEPLGALDRQLREATQLELLKIRETLGLTVLMVTHDQEEAMTLATRMAVMAEGRVLQVGTPTEIYEAPASRAVASFIGRTNLIEVRLREASAGGLMLDAGMGLLLHRPQHSLTPGHDCVLALRPEHIALRTAEPAGPNRFAGTVDTRTFLGERWRYRIRTALPVPLDVSLPAGHFDSAELPAPGASVWVSWSEDAGILLAP